MRGIIDAIYWRLHASYLRNQREDAGKFLAMLEDEMGGEDSLLSAEIGSAHMTRFAIMRKGVRDGTFPRFFGAGYEVELDPSVIVPEKTQKERDFTKSIASSVLLPLVGASPRSIVVLELDMDEFGRCDVVIRDGRTMHVIEVKMGSAPPAVVSQIDRYRMAGELDMCLGLHDRVVAHVVAGSFPPYVSTELSRHSVGMILHEGRPDRLRLVGAYDPKGES